MKKIFYINVFVFVASVANAQNEPYRGGPADGHTKSEQVTPFPLSNSFQPYLGGAGDGFAKEEIVTPFGFANNFAPFFGGSGDGYSSFNVINQVFAFSAQFYAYFGGSNDGWTGYLLTGGLTLPVTLFQFRGEEQNGIHLLHWSTENEINTSHFTVERSSNGISFTNLDRLAAKGAATGRTEYGLTDAKPLKGKNYYRIKMWDKDGSFRLSPIIVLEKKDLFTSLIVFPNPVLQSLRIKLAEPFDGDIIWTISDLQGRRIIQQKTTGNYQMYQINVGHLSAGNYVLEVNTGNRKEALQFTKQ